MSPRISDKACRVLARSNSADDRGHAQGVTALLDGELAHIEDNLSQSILSMVDHGRREEAASTAQYVVKLRAEIKRRAGK